MTLSYTKLPNMYTWPHQQHHQDLGPAGPGCGKGPAGNFSETKSIVVKDQTI